MSLLDIPWRISQVRDALTLIRTSAADDAAAAAAQRDTLNDTLASIDASVATLAAASGIPAVNDLPAAPSIGDIVYYVPYGGLYRFDGDAWRGPRLTVACPTFVAMGYTGGAPLTLGFIPLAHYAGEFWCETLSTTVVVSTTNDGSNYWTFGIATVAAVAIATVSTAAMAVSTTVTTETNVGAFLPSSSAIFRLFSKVGAPGAIYAGMALVGYHRIVV